MQKQNKKKAELNNVLAGEVDSELFNNLSEKGIELDGMTKISLIESSKGLSTIIIFISIYLGMYILNCKFSNFSIKTTYRKF